MIKTDHKINVPLKGSMPAKRADELVPGDIFYTSAGTKLIVIETKILEDGKIELLVDHPIQEYEYFDDNSTHYVKFSPGNMFGVERKK